MTRKEDEQKSFIKVVKESIRKQNSFPTQDQPIIRMPKQQRQEGSWRSAPPKIFSSFMYRTIFFGACYSWNNFGHKFANYNAKNKRTYDNYVIRPREDRNQNHNIFALLNNEVECH